jgi:hypothetical protein
MLKKCQFPSFPLLQPHGTADAQCVFQAWSSDCPKRTAAPAARPPSKRVSAGVDARAYTHTHAHTHTHTHTRTHTASLRDPALLPRPAGSHVGVTGASSSATAARQWARALTRGGQRGAARGRRDRRGRGWRARGGRGGHGGRAAAWLRW